MSIEGIVEEVKNNEKIFHKVGKLLTDALNHADEQYARVHLYAKIYYSMIQRYERLKKENVPFWQPVKKLAAYIEKKKLESLIYSGDNKKVLIDLPIALEARKGLLERELMAYQRISLLRMIEKQRKETKKRPFERNPVQIKGINVYA